MLDLSGIIGLELHGLVLGDPCPHASETPCERGDGGGKCDNAKKPPRLVLQLIHPVPLAPDLVLGPDQISGHRAEEAAVGGAEDGVLGLRHDELRPPPPPPVPRRRQLAVLPPVPLLHAPFV